MQPSPSLAGRSWTASRDEAVRRLAAFVPHAGRLYAATRNYDHGPGDRTNVSVLSPYIRHRIITESEVLAAVLARHSLSAAGKFIQEVFWRTYWKGWLEAHPSAWTTYREALDIRRAEVAADPALQQAFEAAAAGRTGIDAFDAWARELQTTHYLHNHARMWFASMWIFTLGLPWELGADLFMRRLLDGDPASNTLSWRWVAGLQTRGKTYTATRDNIRRYTGDRFEIGVPLARPTVALQEPAPPALPLPDVPVADVPEAPTLLVLHDDDLAGDLSLLPRGLRAVCALSAVPGRSPAEVDRAVLDFTESLAADARARVAAASGAVDLGTVGADTFAGPQPSRAAAGPAAGACIVEAARRCGASRVVTPFAPAGPVRTLLAAAQPAITQSGLGYAEIGRRYDAVAWPAASRAFSGLRSRIPAILAELDIAGG